jgi:hypothetical protein
MCGQSAEILPLGYNRTGGPFNPDFGLSGTGLELHRTFPLLVRVFARSIPVRSRPVPRSVAMNIAQLFRKLRVIANVETVVSLLPEMLFPTQANTGLEWIPADSFDIHFRLPLTIFDAAPSISSRS